MPTFTFFFFNCSINLSATFGFIEKIFKLYQRLLSAVPEVKFIETDLSEVSPWVMDVLVPRREKLIDFL